MPQVSMLFAGSVSWWEPLWQYMLTVLSLLGTAVVAVRYLLRRRQKPSQHEFNTFSRSLAFYWPVYAWGLDSLTTFVNTQFGGCGGPGSAAEYIDWGILGLATLVDSAAVLGVVVLFGASLQFAFIRLLPSARNATVGIPLSAFAAALGVLGFELSLIMIFLSDAGSGRK